MPPALSSTTTGAGPRLVLLHGFTNTARTWGSFADLLTPHYEVLALDLPGHGRSSAIEADLWGSSDLVAHAMGTELALVVGYSMGARVALHLALAHPERISGLVLIGATAGIDDDEARAERRRADEAMAADLRRSGDVRGFLERWLTGPLFAHLPAAVQFLDERCTNTAAGLASSLEQCGTGTQAPLWDRLGELSMPTLLVAGSRDEKFTALGARLAEAIPSGGLVVLEGLGHATHLENPEAMATVIQSFSQSLG